MAQSGQSGPRYDNAMKALCVRAPTVLCRWLGIPVDHGVEVVRLSEVAPKATTRQVDALLHVGGWLVVHLEFQTKGEALFGWRMLEYRTLLARRPELVGMTLNQHVVVLGHGRIDEGVHDDQVDYGFRLHYVREHPLASFLEDPALAPFAVLADLPSIERPDAFHRGLDLIATVVDPELRWVLAQVAFDLADIYLDSDTITSTWEDSAMPVPSFLEKLVKERTEEIERGREEGRAEGRLEGRQEGRLEGRREMVAMMLRQRFGADVRINVVARHLAELPSEDLVTRLENAASLDDLLD